MRGERHVKWCLGRVGRRACLWEDLAVGGGLPEPTSRLQDRTIDHLLKYVHS